jgi:hypothetical protein
MAKKIDYTKTKRLSKGQRAHVRKLKQEARIADVAYKPEVK